MRLKPPEHFDAIIMDLNMPIMDGWEACKRILQIYKDFNECQICLKPSPPINQNEESSNALNINREYENSPK